jgi:Flp pilus assembly protein TadG
VPPRSSDAGQATVEFALVMPLVVALVGCIIGVTVLCLDALALNDTARTTARIASVSVDPVSTAQDYVTSRHNGITVRAATDGSVVTVRVQRRVAFRLPVIGRIRINTPLVASSTMAIEPPIATAPQGTSVTP